MKIIKISNDYKINVSRLPITIGWRSNSSLHARNKFGDDLHSQCVITSLVLDPHTFLVGAVLSGSSFSIHLKSKWITSKVVMQPGIPPSWLHVRFGLPIPIPIPIFYNAQSMGIGNGRTFSTTFHKMDHAASQSTPQYYFHVASDANFNALPWI